VLNLKLYITMKNLVKVSLVAAFITASFVACKPKAPETPAADSTATTNAPAPEPAPAPTTDSAAVKTDSAATK
jgi:hypothetical protein